MATEKLEAVVRVTTDSKKAESQASRTGEKIQKNIDVGAKKVKFGDAIKGQLQKVKQGIQAVGISGEKLSKIGDFFKGGMIAAFAAAVMVVAKALKQMWDDAHESAEQYYDRMKKNQQILDKSINKSQQESRATNEWFNRLHEINNLEKISNTQKAQAAMLIEALTRKYGQLGISVDGATGRYENLYEAQLKVLDLQYDAELKLRQKKAESYIGTGGSAHKAASQVMGMFGDTTRPGNQGSRITTQGEVNTEAYGGDFTKALQMGLDVKLNTRSRKVRSSTGSTSYIELDRQQAKINSRWNQGGLQGKLQWIDFMRKKHAGNAKAQEALIALRTQITQAIIASEQFSAYKATGKPSEQKALQDVSANNRKIQTQSARGETIEKQNEQNRQIQLQQAKYSRLSTLGKINWQTQKNSEAKKEIARATAEVERLKAEFLQSDKNLAEIIKGGNIAKIEVAQRQHLALIQKLNAEKAKLERAKNSLQDTTLEIERLKQQLKRQSNNGGDKDQYYQNQKQQMQFQLKCQKLLLQGKFEQVEKLRMINELKKQGIEYDQQAIQEAIKISKELKGYTIEQILAQQAQNIIDTMEKNPVARRIREIEKTHKINLTDEQKEKVKTLVQFEMRHSNIDQFRLETNQLTRRGGFAGGYWSNRDIIEQQISANTKKTTDILERIKNIIAQSQRY